MPRSAAKPDECVIVVKAQPHRSSKYFETVCCAGVGRDGRWRRQYPVPFRILHDGQKFTRWSWIRYEFTRSPDDRRTESQKVDPESLNVGGKLNRGERSQLLTPLIRRSFEEAETKGESLTLLRPESIAISWIEKTEADIAHERNEHAALANQLSMFDATAKPLEPCPVQFFAQWHDAQGAKHRHECDDWETSPAYIRFAKQYGRQEALAIIKEKYEQEYFNAGLCLAFSTHSRRNTTFGAKNQWLLVGLIRVDPLFHDDLFR